MYQTYQNLVIYLLKKIYEFSINNLHVPPPILLLHQLEYNKNKNQFHYPKANIVRQIKQKCPSPI